MKTRLLIIFVVITSLFIGLPHSDAFFEGGMVIEVPGQIIDISDNIISPRQIMFVNGTFNQPVDDFTANIFKDYEDSSKLVLTLSPASNEFGAFNFNFTIPQDWELGNYHIALENGLQHMAWEFAVRNNYAGGSLDDLSYPVPWMIDSPQTQIEKIDDVLYYVSVPFDRYSSADKIIFQDVTFSPPYTFDPPRHTYTDVIFADGSNETISILFDDPAFTEHVNPQAGFISRTSGSHFLVSVNLDELSPLKQLYSGISPDEIICKADLELIQKTNGLAACVTSDTREKLIQRNWAADFPIKYIIDNAYWAKTYLVHHTMCAHVGILERTEKEMKDRSAWNMTDTNLEKIPIIKSMIEYNSRELYSSSEYPITSTVVSDEIQNQYRQDFDNIVSSKSEQGNTFWYNGKYYDTDFKIC